MNRIVLLLFAWVLLGNMKLNAQHAKGAITFIAEDQQTFYLYVNDQKVNQSPTSVIRIDDVVDKTLRVKIVFNQRPSITIQHNRLPVADADGYMQDITYLVTDRKRGEAAFMPYYIIPLEPVAVDLRAMQVYDYKRYGARKTYNREYDTRYKYYEQNNRRYRPGRNTNPLGNRQEDCKMPTASQFKSAMDQLKKEAFDENKKLLVENLGRNFCFSID